MNRPARWIGLVQALLVVGLAAGVAGRWFPLGVPGEWEWLRLDAKIAVDPVGLGLATLAILAYAGLAAWGARALGDRPTLAREAAWVAALGAAAVGVQALAQEGAPTGYGLAKWVYALRSTGSSGYQTVARTQMPAGLAAFLRAYPAWIDRQDSLHIGTHPPGLFVLARAVDDLVGARPALARWLVEHAPGSVAVAIRAARASGPLPHDEAAGLALTGALTLIGSALTVVPLYLLARASGSPTVAWGAASLWPLLPAAVLFQPTADTAFPLLATSALAAAAWAARPGRSGWRAALAVGSGLILGAGMELTLAFLAVGLVVALILLAATGLRWRTRLALVAAVGLGFGLATAAWWGATRANPAAVWWVNQAHHAQFYRDYPRSRLAWAGANLAEATVAVGLATAPWAVLGLIGRRGVPAATWASLAVLVLLTLTGRSLSEVARLWLPMYPPTLVAAAAAWERSGRHPLGLGWAVALLGAQGLWLEQHIQVVYPI